jgi:nucleoside-diphosphate-sugar epimerase
MRIFVAGGTGAMGRRLVPELVGRGHEVTGMGRSAAALEALRALGARPVPADALDPRAVRAAVEEAEPEVVVHQLTALGGGLDLRHAERTFEATNRLRTEGTDHLLAAARAAGTRRVVAQSFAGWPFARTGGPVKREEDPLDPEPPAALRATLAALRHLEAAVGAFVPEGIVLRYGGFYGPGTSLSAEPGAETAALLRARKFPLVGDAGGVWSFVHIADAASATVAAIESAAPGLYHVVDDEPAPVREWLPHLARVVGAPKPRRVPRWLGRLAAGEVATVMMTEVRGASNAKARRELGWEPGFPSWRRGFAEGLA